MPDPNLWQTFLPSSTLEGSNECGKENLYFPEQETEIAQTSLEGGDNACVCCCLLSIGTSTAS